jgi:hypothetical protein
MFFYDFSDEEIAANKGQLVSASTSRRAAEAYLRSGVRLQSTCGISDVWYDYVESSRHLFEGTPPGDGILPEGESETVSPSPTPNPRHRLRSSQTDFLLNVFQWSAQHGGLPPQTETFKAGPSSVTVASPPSPIVIASSPPIIITSSPPIIIARSPPIVIASSSPIVIGSSPVYANNSQDAQLEESADEVSNGPFSTVPPRDEISTFTEDENDLDEDLSNESGELARKPTMGLELGTNNVEGQAVGGVLGEEDDGFDDFEFEEWPKTVSFTSDMHETMGRVEKILEIPLVATDTFVSSSIPEEREFHLDPVLMGLSQGLTRAPCSTQEDEPMEVAEDEVEWNGEADWMEGVELSQPSQAHTVSADVLSGVSDAGEEEDAEYAEEGE